MTMSSGSDDSDGSEDLLGTHIATEGDTHVSAKERVQRARDNPLIDVRGRPRFHGAFTGGFTAGYYNTVGSKEGWTPSAWRSSRGERAEQSRTGGLRPEDFMDEADKAESLIVQNEFQRPAQGAAGGRGRDGASCNGGDLQSRLLTDLFSVRMPALGVVFSKHAANTPDIAPTCVSHVLPYSWPDIYSKTRAHLPCKRRYPKAPKAPVRCCYGSLAGRMALGLAHASSHGRVTMP